MAVQSEHNTPSRSGRNLSEWVVTRGAYLGLPVVLCLTLLKIRGGLSGGFTHDDLMNLAKALTVEWSILLADTLTVFRAATLHRPAGELVYRLVFEIWGFEPIPFQVIRTILFLCVLVSAWAFTIKLSGSVWQAISVVALLSLHPGFWPFYSSFGFVFDLLCLLCYFSALTLYACESTVTHLSWLRFATIALLYAIALSSKEIGITLPAGIVMVFVVKYGRFSKSARVRSIWLLAVLACLGSAFVSSRVIAPTGLSSVSGYDLDYSAHRVLSNLALVTDELLCGLAGVHLWLAPLLLTCLGILLVWVRTIPGVIALAVGALSYIPLAFAPSRGLSAAFLSLFWLVLAGGFLLRAAFPCNTARGRVCIGAVCIVLSAQQLLIQVPLPLFAEESKQIAALSGAIAPFSASLTKGSIIAIVADDFRPTFPWASSFLLIIHAGHSEFRIWRPEDLEGQEAIGAADLIDLCICSAHTRREVVQYVGGSRPSVAQLRGERMLMRCPGAPVR